MAKLDEDIEIPVKSDFFGWVTGLFGEQSDDEKAKKLNPKLDEAIKKFETATL
jgi:hypothetical protein